MTTKPPIDGTLFQCVMDVAARWPDAIAVRSSGGTCTYQELTRRALAVAMRLTVFHRGDSPAFVILLGSDPVSETAAILGAIAAGGVAIPVDAYQPVHRLARIVTHAAPAAVVSTPALVPLARQLVDESAVSEIPDRVGHGRLDHVRVPPDSPAYVCYTSGSTGEPKGIVATHRQLLERACAGAATFHLEPGDRHTLLHSAAVGAGCSTLWRALSSGGSLLPKRVREDGVAGMLDWLNRERATILACSPTLYRTFLAALAPTDRVQTVRVLRLGGERVTPADFDAFKRHFMPGAQFVNAYSCTEASNITLHFLTHESVCEGELVPVGRPLPDCRVTILDEQGQELPAGTPGEIAVEGPYLSRGYWREPEQTASVFQPVSAAPGTVRLRTGDLGLLDADGVLVHLGRLDFRVKVRGFRVELEGIEAVLQQAPGVSRAALIVQDTGEAGTTLVAYVTADRMLTDEKALRTFAVAHLPSGSVPSQIVLVERLPLTAAGKVDRIALSARHHARQSTMLDVEWSLLSPLHQDIAAIWRAVLGVSGFSAHDDFLATGGDSLRAMRVLSRIRERLGIDISLQEFFASPTVASLVARIERLRQDDRHFEEITLAALLDTIEADRSRRPS